MDGTKLHDHNSRTPPKKWLFEKKRGSFKGQIARKSVTFSQRRQFPRRYPAKKNLHQNPREPA